jgi:hypothetical protein
MEGEAFRLKMILMTLILKDFVFDRLNDYFYKLTRHNQYKT